MKIFIKNEKMFIFLKKGGEIFFSNDNLITFLTKFITNLQVIWKNELRPISTHTNKDMFDHFLEFLVFLDYHSL